MRIAVQNIDWAKGHAAHRALIGHLCSAGVGADVVGLVECKNDDIAALAPAGWTVHQDTSSEARAGCALLVRGGAAGRPSLRLGASRRGVKMLDRWILCAEVGGFRLRLGHYPPKRYRRKWPAFTKALAGSWGRANGLEVFMGDVNQPIRSVPRRLRLRRFHLAAHGEGIDGIFTGPKVKVANAHPDTTGKDHGWTDHPAVIADLSHRGETCR